ncbi:MAG: hypothetical protein KKI08_18265 [Armatimonadetes bacterium]|nr:hypothetical protein [Armatimonadota bacterium]
MDKTRKRTGKKAVYEKPRLKVVTLKPEEQLLACSKVGGGCIAPATS